MTEQDLARMEGRLRAARATGEYARSAEDVPALLAEVRRLQARLRALEMGRATAVEQLRQARTWLDGVERSLRPDADSAGGA